MFQDLDFTGVKPTSVPMERIDVVVDSKVMLDDYAVAFVKECRRNDPRRFEQSPITAEEMQRYCRFLVSERIKCLSDNNPNWRLLKNLYIPVFIQYSLSLIGRVQIKDRGLELFPVIDEEVTMSISDALELSSRIGLFESSVQIRLDAMPRSKEGDLDTMSCALIAGYVRSMREIAHPVSSYIAAFLGFTIRKEQAFSVLYRVQYDDLEFIRSAITNSRQVMGVLRE